MERRVPVRRARVDPLHDLGRRRGRRADPVRRGGRAGRTGTAGSTSSLATAFHGRGVGTDAVRTVARYLVERARPSPADDRPVGRQRRCRAGLREGRLRARRRDEARRAQPRGRWRDALFMEQVFPRRRRSYLGRTSPLDGSRVSREGGATLRLELETGGLSCRAPSVNSARPRPVRRSPSRTRSSSRWSSTRSRSRPSSARWSPTRATCASSTRARAACPSSSRRP